MAILLPQFIFCYYMYEWESDEANQASMHRSPGRSIACQIAHGCMHTTSAKQAYIAAGFQTMAQHPARCYCISGYNPATQYLIMQSIGYGLFLAAGTPCEIHT